ncbi:MAG TPA: type II toxin-antitoxin system RelE/ParE family toxin [Thermoanaerobaculia bacterium]|nr:type II toxin-antitoxin system RelE/ParE family toxin [Thermoanaerobaculia bacterium]
MGSYRLVIKPSAAKELSSIPKRDLERVVEKIRSLSVEPRTHGCQKLSGEERYRIRQGDYRVVYEIDDGERLVTVVKVGNRREVYR